MSIVEITTREGGDRRAKSYSYRKIADNLYIALIEYQVVILYKIFIKYLELLDWLHTYLIK